MSRHCEHNYYCIPPKFSFLPGSWYHVIVANVKTLQVDYTWSNRSCFYGTAQDLWSPRPNNFYTKRSHMIRLLCSESPSSAEAESTRAQFSNHTPFTYHGGSKTDIFAVDPSIDIWKLALHLAYLLSDKIIYPIPNESLNQWTQSLLLSIQVLSFGQAALEIIARAKQPYRLCQILHEQFLKGRAR